MTTNERIVILEREMNRPFSSERHVFFEVADLEHDVRNYGRFGSKKAARDCRARVIRKIKAGKVD